MNNRYDYNKPEEKKLLKEFEDAIKRLLRGRLIYEKTPDVFDKLQDMGFGDEVRFLLFNEKMCILESKKAFRMTTGCDGCLDRVRTCYPGCKEKNQYHKPDKSVIKNPVFTGTIPPVTPTDINGFRRAVDLTTIKDMDSIRLYRDYILWRDFPNHVSPGCSIRYTQEFEPRFDIYWNMQKLIPEKYEIDKKTWEK